MDIVKIVSTVVSFMPNFLLDYVEKKVFRKPDFCQEFDPQEDAKYDIGFVFGGAIDRVKKACELYNSGKIAKILFSGGVGKEAKLKASGTNAEADEHAKYAIFQGVSSSDILVENSSSNTEENVSFSMEMLKKEGYVLPTTKVLVITSDFHVRRCLKLLGKYLSMEQMAWVGVKWKYSDGWRNSERGRFWIFKEFCQILIHRY